MSDSYLTQKQETLPDYSIFMAIAEEIGYDATGRESGNNDLVVIEEELTRFIEHINSNEAL